MPNVQPKETRKNLTSMSGDQHSNVNPTQGSAMTNQSSAPTGNPAASAVRGAASQQSSVKEKPPGDNDPERSHAPSDKEEEAKRKKKQSGLLKSSIHNKLDSKRSKNSIPPPETVAAPTVQPKSSLKKPEAQTDAKNPPSLGNSQAEQKPRRVTVLAPENKINEHRNTQRHSSTVFEPHNKPVGDHHNKKYHKEGDTIQDGTLASSQKATRFSGSIARDQQTRNQNKGQWQNLKKFSLRHQSTAKKSLMNEKERNARRESVRIQRNEDNKEKERSADMKRRQSEKDYMNFDFAKKLEYNPQSKHDSVSIAKKKR